MISSPTQAERERRPGTAGTCVIVGPASPELRAITSGLARHASATAEIALGPGDPATEVDAVRHRLERLMAAASSCVVLALPDAPPEEPGAELDDVGSWSATRAFYLLQALLPSLRRRGRSIVLVTGAEGFPTAPGSVRGAVESQAVMALTRVLAAEVAPDARASCVAVQGDLLHRAEAVCGTVAFLLSDDAAHITGQTLVVGCPTVPR